MKQRPSAVSTISLIFLLIPLAVLANLAFNPDNEAVGKLHIVTLDALLVCIGSYAVGVGLWRVRPWGYYLFFGFITTVIGFTLYQMFIEKQPFSVMQTMMIVYFSIAAIFLLQRQIAAPYFNPKLRWWERNPRFPVNLEGQFKFDGVTHSAAILDISQTGCFTNLEAQLRPGDSLKVLIKVLDFDFSIESKVIRRSLNPAGFGIVFLDLDRNSKKQLETLLRHLATEKSRNPTT
jgi:hypothetical protein